MSLNNQNNIIVIGSYGGIGQALVNILTSHNANVLLVGRDEDKLKNQASATGQHHAVCDATRFDEVDACVADFKSHGDITAIVNLPGSILLKPCQLLTEKDIDDTIAVNLKTAFAAARAAAKHMAKTGGSVVMMSTAAVHIGLPNHEAIAAAKGGVEGLMRSAAATYAKNQLRFNCVAPGLVDTPLAKNITGNERALDVSLRAHPLGRIGNPDDIARAIAFLIDPDNSWISGQVITVDGGLSGLKLMA